MTRLIRIAILWALGSGVTLAATATFSAIPVSGYNYGGIVPNTAAPPYSGTASTLDLSNNALFEAGLPAATAGGLAASGAVNYTNTSGAFGFTLGPYGNMNLLRVNPSGTLTLVTPKSYPAIGILGFSTESSSPGAIEMVGDVTLHFSDDSSSVYSKGVDLSDWYAAAPLNLNVVTSALGGRVNITAGTAASAYEYTANGPQFYVSVVTLTQADAAKTLTSVDFGNFPFGGNTFQFIMALAGQVPTSPITPTSAPALSVWGLGTLALLMAGSALLALRRV